MSSRTTRRSPGWLGLVAAAAGVLVCLLWIAGIHSPLRAEVVGTAAPELSAQRAGGSCCRTVRAGLRPIDGAKGTMDLNTASCVGETGDC